MTRIGIWFQKMVFWGFQNSKLNFVTTNGMQETNLAQCIL